MKGILLVGFISACTLAAQPTPGTGSIEGHVFNSLTKEPVRKASVTLRTSQIWLTAYTDAEGRFQFTALPPGTYKLSAKQSGFLDHAARRPIVLGTDEHVTDTEVRLPPQGVISGRVVDEDGDPVGGAQIIVFKQAYRDGRKQWDRLNIPASTNDSGEYRFPNLSSGRYLAQALTERLPLNNRFGEPPQMDNARVYYPSAVSEEAASSVEVGVGADVRGIDIHLFKVARPSRFHVTGKVMGAQAGTLISLGYGDAGPPDYLFDLSLPAGQHTIFAHVYSGGPEAFAIETLTVAGNITGLVLTMRPPPEVSGQIRLAESGRQADLKGVIITLNNHPTYLIYNQYAKSDALGQFVFAQPVPPGRYAMKVNPGSLPNGCFVQQMTLGRQEVSEGDVEILTSTSLEIVLSNTAGTITGSAADDDGKLFPNSIVTLIPPDAKSRPVKQVADDDGNFKFTNLRPGKYKLFAWEEVDDGLWPDPEFRKAYEKRATEITVGPKETQSAQLRVIAAQEIK